MLLLKLFLPREEVFDFAEKSILLLLFLGCLDVPLLDDFVLLQRGTV